MKLGLKRSKSTTSSIFELVVIVLVALGLALGIQAFVVKPYRIPSGSMEPTLAIGQRVLVNRIGMQFSDPHVGEIAVFHPPRDAQQEVCGPTPHVIRVGGAACAEPEPHGSGESPSSETSPTATDVDPSSETGEEDETGVLAADEPA